MSAGAALSELPCTLRRPVLSVEFNWGDLAPVDGVKADTGFDVGTINHMYEQWGRHTGVNPLDFYRSHITGGRSHHITPVPQCHAYPYRLRCLCVPTPCRMYVYMRHYPKVAAFDRVMRLRA